MGLFDEVKKYVWMAISHIETILSMVIFVYSIQWKYKTQTMIHSLDKCGLKFILSPPKLNKCGVGYSVSEYALFLE